MSGINFFSLLVLMVVIWTTGRIFKRFRLPEVFGELLGGVIVGPAALGIVTGESEVITVLAELGIFFLMLHAGLKTDPQSLAKTSGQSLLIALCGIALPFAGGYAAARAWGFPLDTSLFIALAVSISALALLVRLFQDFKLVGRRFASAALGAAVIDNIIALILFSLIIGIVQQGDVHLLGIARIFATTTLFLLVIVIGGIKIQPYLKRYFRRGNRSFMLTLIAALCIGLLAEAVGLHMILGAFFAGLFIREEVLDEETFQKIEDRYYGLTYGFFGPVFFASIAFHIDFSSLVGAPLFLVVITAIAMTGKIAGVTAGALLTRMSWQESLFTGLAMNTRGGVELVIISVGLQTGLIDDTLFSVLVLMAFVSTLFSTLAAAPLARMMR